MGGRRGRGILTEIGEKFGEAWGMVRTIVKKSEYFRNGDRHWGLAYPPCGANGREG